MSALESISKPFLVLLRSGLWNKPIAENTFDKLSDKEWAQLYSLSKAQTVEGLVFDGILNLPSIFHPPSQLLLQWTARIDAIERLNINMKKSMFKLVKGFSDRGLKIALLKGFGLAKNYEKPLSRSSGDIDLFFLNKADFNFANEFLKSKGVDVGIGDHESTFYKFGNIDYEHHTKMIDVFNPFSQKYIKELIAAEESDKEVLRQDEFEIELPSYLLANIQANAHILKHFLGFGIGLRQLCDVTRLCYVQPESFNGELLRNAYSKLGLKKWMDLIYSFMVDQLGLSPEKLPYKINYQKDTSWLMEDVLQVGNFGFYDSRLMHQSGELKRENSRTKILQKVLPHVYKGFVYAPSEAFWFPVMKIYTKLFNR